MNVKCCYKRAAVVHYCSHYGCYPLAQANGMHNIPSVRLILYQSNREPSSQCFDTAGDTCIVIKN